MKEILSIFLLILTISGYTQQRNSLAVSDAAMIDSNAGLRDSGRDPTIDGKSSRLYQKNGDYAVHTLESDAKSVAEENKTSATMARMYDTFIPPVCLLLILWFAFALPGHEKGKSP